MKYPITVSVSVGSGFVVCEEAIPPQPWFCVTARTGTPYYNQDNYYRTRWEDPDILRAVSVNDLYDCMARVRVDQMIYGEKCCRQDSQLRVEDFVVTFSDIFIEVESYNEDCLKATATYQSIGAERDAQRAKDKAAAEQHRKDAERRYAKEREERDRAEFERLRKKYELQKPNHAT